MCALVQCSAAAVCVCVFSPPPLPPLPSPLTSGVDRHLFCLYVLSRYLELESPFLDKVQSPLPTHNTIFFTHYTRSSGIIACVVQYAYCIYSLQCTYLLCTVSCCAIDVYTHLSCVMCPVYVHMSVLIVVQVLGEPWRLSTSQVCVLYVYCTSHIHKYMYSTVCILLLYYCTFFAVWYVLCCLMLTQPLPFTYAVTGHLHTFPPSLSPITLTPIDPTPSDRPT